MITLITGGLGTGKTCKLTAYGIKDHLLNNKRPIYSNYHLYNYKYIKLDIVELYLESPELHNITIIADELYTFMDCRCSMKERNRLESYFIAQTRKKDCNLFLTSQYTAFADFRLLLFIDFFIKMSNIWVLRTVKDINNNDICIKDKHPYLFNCDITDYTNEQNIFTKHFVFDGRQWFKEYNTNEVIYPPDDYMRLGNANKKKMEKT